MLDSKNDASESKIISFGGSHTLRKCMQVFDLEKTTVQTYPDLPQSLEFHQVLKFDQHAFCIGGLVENCASKRVWKLKKFKNAKSTTARSDFNGTF